MSLHPDIHAINKYKKSEVIAPLALLYPIYPKQNYSNLCKIGIVLLFLPKISDYDRAAS